jgi:hypothetical protein
VTTKLDGTIVAPRDDVKMRRSTGMTISELKRQMDRRFDRLERTKADKAHLRRFPTKAHLRRELRRFVRREDFAQLEQLMVDGFAEVNALIKNVLNTVVAAHEHRIRDLENHVFGS